MFPTPTNHQQNTKYQQGGTCLQATVNQGQLNPDWVELLMGFPQGWTDAEAEPTPFTGWHPGWEGDTPRVTQVKKNRVNRIKCLGNAVVPQNAEVFAKAIKEVENGRS